MRQRDLLAVHPDYFLLTGGIERWLYRLARKAVPEKMEPPEIRFRLETLFEVSGLAGRLRDFRSAIERIADDAPLPEYSVRVVRNRQHELVTLYRDHAKPGRTARSTGAVEHLAVPTPEAPPVIPGPSPALVTPPVVTDIVRHLEPYYRQAIARGEEPEFLIVGGNGELVNTVLRLLEEAQRSR
jgi:hypothetical protein